MRLFLVLFLFLLGCGVHSRHTDNVSEANRGRLQAMYAIYKGLYAGHVDMNGFVGTENCDSLIMTGLSNPNANLEAAEVTPGEWLRRPVNYPECYASGGSATDISRDGLLGVMWWSLENKRLDILNHLWDYGTSHNWVMGNDGDLTTRMANPYMIALLAQEIKYLGGGDYAVRFTLYPDTSPNGGSASQLQAVQNLIKWKSLGSQQVGDMTFATKLYESDPINPLYAYVLGQADLAAELLLEFWPNTRLPTSSDFCTDWRISQDIGQAGLSPCPQQNLTHSGGDFLMVARLILEGY